MADTPDLPGKMSAAELVFWIESGGDLDRWHTIREAVSGAPWFPREYLQGLLSMTDQDWSIDRGRRIGAAVKHLKHFERQLFNSGRPGPYSDWGRSGEPGYIPPADWRLNEWSTEDVLERLPIGHDCSPPFEVDSVPLNSNRHTLTEIFARTLCKFPDELKLHDHEVWYGIVAEVAEGLGVNLETEISYDDLWGLVRERKLGFGANLACMVWAEDLNIEAPTFSSDPDPLPEYGDIQLFALHTWLAVGRLYEPPGKERPIRLPTILHDARKKITGQIIDGRVDVHVRPTRTGQREAMARHHMRDESLTFSYLTGDLIFSGQGSAEYYIEKRDKAEAGDDPQRYDPYVSVDIIRKALPRFFSTQPGMPEGTEKAKVESKRRSRKITPEWNWEIAKRKFTSLMDHNGDLSEDDPDWCRKSQIIEPIRLKLRSLHGVNDPNLPAYSAVQSKVDDWIAEWRAQRKRSSADN